MPVIFILGIIGIALEEQIKINKTATALLTAVVLWSILLIDTDIASVTEGFHKFLSSCSLASRRERPIRLPLPQAHRAPR